MSKANIDDGFRREAIQNNQNQTDTASLHKQICEQMTSTYIRKNNDYGNAFANLRNEIPNAILVRLYDKYSRLKTLMSGEKQMVNDESIDDTLLDLANYCILELIERKLERDKADDVIVEYCTLQKEVK